MADSATSSDKQKSSSKSKSALRTYDFEPSPYEVSAQTRAGYDALITKTHSEDLVDEIKNLQLIFLCDISASMKIEDEDPEGRSTTGVFGKWTRYDSMVKLLNVMVSDLFKYDADGKVPCYIFDDAVRSLVCTDPAQLVAQVQQHRPNLGSTDLSSALELAISENVPKKKSASTRVGSDGAAKKKFLFIVFTDGVPDSPEDVERVVRKRVYKADKKGERIKILFVRFGDDKGAIQFLEDMDDHPIFHANVDSKSDNAAYCLGPKLLVLNAMFEQVERQPDFADLLKQHP